MSQVLAANVTGADSGEFISSPNAQATVLLSSPGNTVVPFGATVQILAKSEQAVLTKVMTLTSENPIAAIPFGGTFIARRLQGSVNVAVDVTVATAIPVN
jgi:hypothetical protein